MPADLDLADHAEVMRRVVHPVLGAMYRDGEVVGAEVRVIDDRLYVLITSVDGAEEYDIGYAQSGMVDAHDLAYRLADYIEEYISETSFAWGEQRSMHGPLPPAKH